LRDFVTAGSWYIRGIGIFICYQDQYHLQVARENFMYCYQAASLEERAKIKALWEQAGLGLFLFDEGIKQSEERSS
jgi:hypothetical protein